MLSAHPSMPSSCLHKRRAGIDTRWYCFVWLNQSTSQAFLPCTSTINCRGNGAATHNLQLQQSPGRLLQESLLPQQGLIYTEATVSQQQCSAVHSRAVCAIHTAQSARAAQKQDKSKEHLYIEWWDSAPQDYMKPLAKKKTSTSPILNICCKGTWPSLYLKATAG